MHGNIYELKSGWLKGELYNVLPYHTGDIEGHFTIIFKKDGSDFKVYKHGDYATSAPLTSFNKVEFKGFLSLSNTAEEFFKKDVIETIGRLQFYKEGGRKQMGTLWVFDFEDYQEPPPFDETTLN